MCSLLARVTSSTTHVRNNVHMFSTSFYMSRRAYLHENLCLSLKHVKLHSSSRSWISPYSSVSSLKWHAEQPVTEL